jgi:electron transfer flavoprotein beta subunit
MNICVFVKQVPSESKVTPGDNTTLRRDGVAHVINPADLNALEEALRIKDQVGAYVTVCTMGPASSETMLRHVGAMGADRLCLISDTAFAGSDTYATARTLSYAVKRLGDFDLFLCGRRTIDGETGQVGPELAALLDIPCATNCVSIMFNNDASMICRRMLEKAHETWCLPLPALVTVYNSINAPRLPSILGLRHAKNLAIMRLTAADLGLYPSECGLRGSPTQVVHITTKTIGKRTPVFMTSPNGISATLDIVADANRKE